MIANKKPKQIHLTRPNAQERRTIQEKIQTRTVNVPLGENDVPGNVNWDRTTQLGKTIFLHQKLDFVLQAWDRLVLEIIPTIISSHDVMTVDGRVYYDQISWQRPSITPREAMLHNQTYAATLYAVPFLIPNSEIEEYQRRGGNYQVQRKMLSERRRKIVELPVPIGSCLCRSYPERGPVDPDELNLMGICPYAAKGWFIIGGTEFMIRFQEQGRTNTFSIRTGPKLKANRNAQREYVRQARMTYKTPYGSQLVYMFIEKDKSIEVYLSFMKRRWKGQVIGDYMTMPLLSLFRLCQKEFNADSTIQQIAMLGDPKNANKIYQGLIPSLLRIGGIGDDVEYYVKNTQDMIAIGDAGRDLMRRRIDETLFSFATEMSLDERLLQLKVMAAMLMEVEQGLRPEDNPNDWQHKKIVLPSDQMELLFNSYYMRRVSDIQANVLKSSTRAEKVPDLFDSPADWLTSRIHKCFSTGKWGVDEVWVKNNITMALKVENPVSTWDEMKKINVPTRERNTDLVVRGVRLNQIGFVCTTQTPEGANCGLVKSMSDMCITSRASSDFEIRKFIRGEFVGHSKKWLINPFANNNNVAYKLLLNGKLLGWAEEELYHVLKRMRRSGAFDRFVSISLDIYDKFIKVYTDGSRPVRPLLVLDNQNLVIDQKNLWDASVDQLIVAGALEYIDPAEQENAVIAQSIDDLQMARISGSFLYKEIVILENELAKLTVRLTNVPEQLAELEGERARVLAGLEEGRRADPEEFDVEEYMKAGENELRQVNNAISQLTGLKDEYDRKKTLLLEKQFLFNKIYVVEEKVVKTDLVDSGDINILSQKELSPGLVQQKVVRQRTRYTHCEPDPAGTASISANLIPNVNFDQGARAAFQCKMNTQAMGLAASNDNDNLDSSLKVMVAPRPALIKTRLTDLLGLDKLPIGDYVLLAIMPWYGYNQEDSVIINKKAIDNGKFTSVKYSTYRYTLSAQMGKGVSSKEAFYEDFYRPINPVSGKPYEHLDEYGYPIKGEEIPSGGIVLGIKRVYYNDIQNNKAVEKDISIKTGFLEQGRVDSVYFINQGSNDETVIVKLYSYHTPQPGDKFAIPHAQKATFSLPYPDTDLPFVEAGPLGGLKPDMIINQHSVPSRMAVGMMWEILMTTLGAELAKDIDASAYRPINMDEMKRGLVQFGYNPYGLVNMINGITGEQIPAQIFMGPTYALALKHLVDLKAQVSNEMGRRDPTTLQGVKGRKQQGKLRFGEMERDNFIGHSAPFLLLEIFCHSSDPYDAILCDNCGAIAAINMQLKSGKCRVCGNQAKFAVVTLPFVSIDIVQHLAMANVRLLLQSQPIGTGENIAIG